MKTHQDRSGTESFAQRFLDEALLYSGQYALFYVLMNFSDAGPAGFFANYGHAALLAVLLVQTAALARWGGAVLPRLLLSLLAPAAYAAMESTEGLAFLLDMGHAFFWAFSLAAALLQAASRLDAPRRRRMAFEFLVTFVNVAAFFAVYLYFDLKLGAVDGGLAGEELRRALSIANAPAGLALFVADKAHVYVLVGGVFLALTIAVGRVKVLALTERINELFGQYVDPRVRDEIVRGNGGRPRNRELCVLFADIRDFTTLSEKESPERVRDMLNVYFTEWEEAIARRGGAVDKYIGDAVMAVFGVNGGNACDAAAACAQDLLQRFPALRARLIEAGLPAPRAIGVGMDYGPVIMGDLGSRRRKNFTVIGDRVNTASRLEALCKSYGRVCLVSGDVASRLGPENAERFERLGKTLVKGKASAVEVWALKERGSGGLPPGAA